MEIKYLLKSQSNLLFEIIKSNGYQPSEFEWEKVTGPYSGQEVSVLVHKASGFFFVFDNWGGNFFSQWAPAYQILSESEDFGSWHDQSLRFQQWLSYLKRETDSPDFWSAIADEGRIIESAASSETSNAPFNADEKTYIVNGLNEIKEYLLTAHKLDPELVESRLKYLVESSDRLGRKDWLNLLLSILVSIVINAALTPDATRELFRFVGTALRLILNGPLLLT